MPTQQLLEPEKTVSIPLSSIMKDESTTSNNIAILDHIFRFQFSLSDDHEDWVQKLRIVAGDVKTWNRINAVKLLRGSVSSRPYDTFQWVLPSIGLWHLRYNFLQLIHAMHWGRNSPPDASTLQFAADRWKRSQVVQPTNFQAMEDLIVHSYYARMVGFWILQIRERSRQSLPKDVSDLTPIVSSFHNNRDDWINIIKKVAEHTSIPKPTTPWRTRN